MPYWSLGTATKDMLWARSKTLGSISITFPPPTYLDPPYGEASRVPVDLPEGCVEYSPVGAVLVELVLQIDHVKCHDWRTVLFWKLVVYCWAHLATYVQVKISIKFSINAKFLVPLQIGRKIYPTKSHLIQFFLSTIAGCSIKNVLIPLLQLCFTVTLSNRNNYKKLI